MSRVQAAVFPGVGLGCMMVVWLGLAFGGVTPPVVKAEAALAAIEETPVAAEAESQVGDGCPVSERYPEEIRQWCGLISSMAEEFGVDANLVAAVMLQESGGDADIISVSGAVGLLQVMPRDGQAATFECINGPCFASRPSTSELTDPEFNLRYGVRMLAGLYEKKGDWREALMAYGPMDVGYRYADNVLAIYSNYK